VHKKEDAGPPKPPKLPLRPLRSRRDALKGHQLLLKAKIPVLHRTSPLGYEQKLSQTPLLLAMCFTALKKEDTAAV
jgi:hypothetical protein